VHLALFLTFQNGTGDANDVWKVVIVGGKEDDPVTTVSSKLKFIHYLQHCEIGRASCRERVSVRV
jgi:dolichyl-phosphate-mannose--protein O-mannosyl transferase